MVQAETKRHRAGRGSASIGAGQRFGVVVVSVDEQKLQACPPEQSTGGAEEATPFRLARQVAEVAEGHERVALLLDGALDEAAQMASVAVQVTEDEQPAHSSRDYLARAAGHVLRCLLVRSRADDSASRLIAPRRSSHSAATRASHSLAASSRSGRTA